MTEPELTTVVLLLAAVAIMAWGRWPREMVAFGALLIGVATGVVAPAAAFAGFGNGGVVLLAATTVIAAAVTRSGAVEVALRPLLRRFAGSRINAPLLAGVAAVLASGVRRNAASRIVEPVATRLAARGGTSARAAHAAVATMATLGGLMTLIGAVPNIVVSAFRERAGDGFGMFDFAPVGIGVAATGLIATLIVYRFVPMADAAAIGGFGPQGRRFTAEARLPADSPFVARRVADVEAAAGGGVDVAVIVRERFRRVAPRPDRVLYEDDRLLLCGDPDDIERLVTNANLTLLGDGSAAGEATGTVLEGVVTTGSPLAGATTEAMRLHDRYGLSLLAVSRRGVAIDRPLRHLRIDVGDLLILKGERDRVDDAMETLRILPLSDRQVTLGTRRRSWWPLAVLAAAMAAASLGTVPPAVMLAAAALAVLVLRLVTVDEAYRTPGWSNVVALAALLPIAEALRANGAGEAIAATIVPVLASLSIPTVVALVIVAAAAVAWPVGGLGAVLLLAPVAVLAGGRLTTGGDALLMAVAVGATCGVTPTIPGRSQGRRWKLATIGFVAIVATPLIALVWVRG